MGFLDRFFGSDKPKVATPTPAAKARVGVEDVLARYGALVESPDAPTPGLSVADTRVLPYPKAVIENALAAVIATTREQHFREQATFSYLMLANFQDGVGPGIVGLSAQDVRRMSQAGSDPSALLDSEGQMSAADLSNKFAAFEKWKIVIERDSYRLQAKLDQVKSAIASRQR